MNNINLVVSMIMIGALLPILVANQSYSQLYEMDEGVKAYMDNCTELDYLANLTNIKIINMLISKTIKQPCIDKIDQFLEQGYTIKGTLQDKFIILEKIK